MKVNLDMVQQNNPECRIVEEVWQDIPSYSQLYQVSNWGNVRSKEHEVSRLRSNGRPYSQVTHSKVLSLHVDQITGYVCAWLQVRPKARNCSVHRLVAEAFLGAIPEGHVVNHLDGNKQNNYFQNLDICTSSQNRQHALKTGLSVPNTSNFIEAGFKASCKPIYVEELDRYFVSGTECVRELGLLPDYVNRLFQKRKQSRVYDSTYNLTFVRIKK